METNKKQLNILVLGAIGIVLLGALYFFLRDTTGAEKVVARVGDEEITQQDFDIRIRQLTVRGALNGLSVPQDAIPDRAIDTLIDESLLYQDAVRQGFTASEEEVELRYQTTRDNFDSEEAFRAKMEENLLTPEIFRDNIARQIVIISYLEEVKRQRIQEQLDQNPQFTSEDGTTLTVTAERTPLSQDEIQSLTEERTAELKEEFEVEVFLD